MLAQWSHQHRPLLRGTQRLMNFSLNIFRPNLLQSPIHYLHCPDNRQIRRSLLAFVLSNLWKCAITPSPQIQKTELYRSPILNVYTWKWLRSMIPLLLKRFFGFARCDIHLRSSATVWRYICLHKTVSAGRALDLLGAQFSVNISDTTVCFTSMRGRLIELSIQAAYFHKLLPGNSTPPRLRNDKLLSEQVEDGETLCLSIGACA